MQIKLVSYRKLPSSSTKSKPQQVVFTGGSKIAKTKYQLGLTASYTKDFQWRQREPNPFPRKKPCSRKHILLEVVNAAVVLMHTYTCVRLWLLVCWAIPIAMWLHIYRKHSSTFKLWDEMYTLHYTESYYWSSQLLQLVHLLLWQYPTECGQNSSRQHSKSS